MRIGWGTSQKFYTLTRWRWHDDIEEWWGCPALIVTPWVWKCFVKPDIPEFRFGPFWFIWRVCWRDQSKPSLSTRPRMVIGGSPDGGDDE